MNVIHDRGLKSRITERQIFGYVAAVDKLDIVFSEFCKTVDFRSAGVWKS